MKKQGWGRIVTITSIAARQPINDLVISSSIRPGLLGLTKVLGNQDSADGICINAVAPGFIITELTQDLPEELQDQIRKQTPLGHFGTVDDIANAVAFLASDEAGYITGQVLAVDGGLVMM
jgi:3-oxoacyl-[acyl-carrier protein] reductase